MSLTYIYHENWMWKEGEEEYMSKGRNWRARTGSYRGGKVCWRGGWQGDKETEIKELKVGVDRAGRWRMKEGESEATEQGYTEGPDVYKTKNK